MGSDWFRLLKDHQRRNGQALTLRFLIGARRSPIGKAIIYIAALGKTPPGGSGRSRTTESSQITFINVVISRTKLNGPMLRKRE